MLDNLITVSVDEADDTVLVPTEFRRFEEFQNRSIYIGPGHSLESRYLLGFYRTPPKRVGNYRGTAKSALKLTEDVIVDGADSTTQLVMPQLGEISFSIPVGTPDASALRLRQSLVAILQNDDLWQRLCRQQEI